MTVRLNVVVTEETPDPLAFTVMVYVPGVVVAATLSVTVAVVVLPDV